MQGYIKASTDPRKYVSGNDWVEFGYMNGLRLTGGGTFDGQGNISRSYECSKMKHCRLHPAVSVWLMDAQVKI